MPAPSLADAGQVTTRASAQGAAAAAPGAGRRSAALLAGLVGTALVLAAVAGPVLSTRMVSTGQAELVTQASALAEERALIDEVASAAKSVALSPAAARPAMLPPLLGKISDLEGVHAALEVGGQLPDGRPIQALPADSQVRARDGEYQGFVDLLASWLHSIGRPLPAPDADFQVPHRLRAGLPPEDRVPPAPPDAVAAVAPGPLPAGSGELAVLSMDAGSLSAGLTEATAADVRALAAAERAASLRGLVASLLLALLAGAAGLAVWWWRRRAGRHARRLERELAAQRERAALLDLAAQERSAAARLLAETTDAIPDAVMRWDPVHDEQGTLVDFTLSLSNPAGHVLLSRLAGAPVELGTSLRAAFAGSAPGALATFAAALQAPAPTTRSFEGPGVRRHELTIARIRRGPEHGAAGGTPESAGSHSVLVSAHDVHERWLAERELALAHARAEALVAQSPAATALLDADLRYVQVNDAAIRLLGLPRQRLLGQPVLDVVHPDLRAERLLAFEQLRSGATELVRSEQPYLHPSGFEQRMRVSASAVRDVDGQVQWFVVHLLDVTEDHHAAARLRHDATHDPLTLLPNRALLLERLEHALSRREGQAGDLAVVFVDLDGLKAVNDTLGHAAGDHLLVEAGRRIGAAVRPHDTVARLGGDEYVVLLADQVSDRDARRIAGRIRSALADPVELPHPAPDGRGTLLQQYRPWAGASLGVALAGPGDTAESLLNRADEAMYRDKLTRRRARLVAPDALPEQRSRTAS